MHTQAETSWNRLFDDDNQMTIRQISFAQEDFRPRSRQKVEIERDRRRWLVVIFSI